MHDASGDALGVQSNWKNFKLVKHFLVECILGLQFRLVRWIFKETSRESRRLKSNIQNLREREGPGPSPVADGSEERWLRHKLRAVPNWYGGHAALGRRCLARGAIAEAYSEGRAMVALAQTVIQKQRGELLLTRCYLARGAVQEARELLQQLQRHEVRGEFLWEIREECGALELLVGNVSKAEALFAAIPPRELSPEGHAALRYARDKLAQQ